MGLRHLLKLGSLEIRKMDEKVDEFIIAYAKDVFEVDWDINDVDLTIRKLCENYWYSGKIDKFLFIALGWFAAKSDNKFPYVEANAKTAVLKFKMDKIYKIVCAENGWDEECD